MSQQELLEKRRARRAARILVGAGDRLKSITDAAHGGNTAALGERPVTPSPAVAEEALRASTSSSGRHPFHSRTVASHVVRIVSYSENPVPVRGSPVPSPSTSTTSVRSIPVSTQSATFTTGSNPPLRQSTSFSTNANFSTPPAATLTPSSSTQSASLGRTPSLSSQTRRRPSTIRRSSDDPDDSLGAPPFTTTRNPLNLADHFRTENPDEQARVYRELMLTMGMVPPGGDSPNGFPPGFFPPGMTTPGGATTPGSTMGDMPSFPFPPADNPFGGAGYGPLTNLLLQGMTGNYGQPNVPQAQDKITRWWSLVHFVAMVLLALWILSGQWAAGAKELARLVWYSPYHPFHGDEGYAVAGKRMGGVGWDGLTRVVSFGRIAVRLDSSYFRISLKFDLPFQIPSPCFGTLPHWS